GNSPLLADKEVREANSNGGVNVVIWEGAVDVKDMHRVEVWNSFLGTFIELHRGFLLREIVGHGSSEETLAAVARAGYLFVSNVDGHYTEAINRSPHELIGEPHLIGLTRDLASGRVGTWASSLFIYE